MLNILYYHLSINRDNFNIEILNHFARLYNFFSTDIVEALRLKIYFSFFVLKLFILFFFVFYFLDAIYQHFFFQVNHKKLIESWKHLLNVIMNVIQTLIRMRVNLNEKQKRKMKIIYIFYCF